MLQSFFRTLIGAAPIALTLSAYTITFYYPGDIHYFAGVGGTCIAVVGLVTTLLLANQLNHAYVYPLLARLPSRIELMIALLVSAYIVTVLMAILFTLLVIGTRKLSPTIIDLLILTPRWLVLYLFVTSFGLHMTKLVSRHGSYLLAYLSIALVLVIPQQRYQWMQSQMGTAFLDAFNTVASPISRLLTDEVAVHNLGMYMGPLVLTLMYAIILFLVACGLFQRKDLLWSE
ncbi:MAG: hypothetical protein AAF639_31895 [Chloroflexota bacterium]